MGFNRQLKALTEVRRIKQGAFKESSVRKDQVDWYIQKFKDKMKGSHVQVAKGWVDAIGNLTQDEKDMVWEAVKKYCSIKPDRVEESVKEARRTRGVDKKEGTVLRRRNTEDVVVDCGFAVITTDGDVLKQNLVERAESGEVDFSIEDVEAYLKSEQVVDDYLQIESNVLAQLKKVLVWVQDEGHSGNNAALVGSCTIPLSLAEDAYQARMEEDPAGWWGGGNGYWPKGIDTFAFYEGVSAIGQEGIDVEVYFFDWPENKDGEPWNPTEDGVGNVQVFAESCQRSVKEAVETGSEQLSWEKVPSVTTGGRKYFWFAKTDKPVYTRFWVLGIRGTEKYKVDIERGKEKINLGEFNTEQAGKKAAQEWYDFAGASLAESVRVNIPARKRLRFHNLRGLLMSTAEENKALWEGNPTPDEAAEQLKNEFGFTDDQIEIIKKGDWKSVVESSKRLTETGEPDGEYDTELYDAVCKELQRNGFPASHKEFDKYQGTYIQVAGKKLWTEELFTRGEQKNPPQQYRDAKLVDAQGESWSANPGDYFGMGPEDRFPRGTVLVLTKQDGSKVRINRPRKADLPEDVGAGIEYKKGTIETVLRLKDEDQLIDAEVIVSEDLATVDASELVAQLKATKTESRRRKVGGK